MPYSDDELRKRIEELERRVAVLEKPRAATAICKCLDPAGAIGNQCGRCGWIIK